MSEKILEEMTEVKMSKKILEEMTAQEIDQFLTCARVGRIGIALEDEPYIVPVGYGYENGKVFFHSCFKGLKMNGIKQNPNVCFEVELDHKIHNTGIPCKWSTTYKSIIGYGTASILTDIKEKKKALKILIDHYASGTIYDFSNEMVDNVAVIKITINSMTGKQSLD